VFSPRDCQSLCTFNAACIFFVYRHTDRHCYLKKAKSGVDNNPSVISGPRQCTMYNGKNIHILMELKLSENKSSLLPRIILRNTQAPQLLTINMKQKLFTKFIKNAKLEGFGKGYLKFY
jgi:hypothetical protein